MKFISLILFQLFLITLITSIKDREFIDDKVSKELKPDIVAHDALPNQKPNPNNRTLQDTEGEILPEFSLPDSLHSDLLIDRYLNKGYSLIEDQSDLIFRPASTLAKYSIFDHKIKIDEVLKGISTDEIILEKFDTPKINKGQRQIKEYDYNEIKKAIDFVIHGEYKLPYNNFLYERGLSIEDLKSKKTVMYIHEKIDFTLTLNTQKNFPRLSKFFIADAIKVFDRPEIRSINEDMDFVRHGLNFFSKYGTNYLNRTKYGSRFVWISELNLTKWDNQPSTDTSQETTSFKSGSIAFETSRDLKNDRLNSFEISSELGNCEINMLENRMEKCNSTLSSVGLLGFEVEYLYRIFDPERIKAPILQPDNTPLPADRLKNIHTNMKMLLEALTSSIDVRNLYIRDLISFNNFRADYGDALPCTKNFKIKHFGGIPNSLFSYDTRDNRFMPVFKISHLNKVNYQNFYLISKARSQTFMCNLKDKLFDQAIIDSPYLFNKRYLTDIALFEFEDFKQTSPNFNKTSGFKLEDCQNFWVGSKSNFETNSNVNIVLVCLKYGNVFLDKNIITDIKVKSFVNNECANFSLNNRDYECLCDMEFKKMKSSSVNGNNNVNGNNRKQSEDESPAGNSTLNSSETQINESGAPDNTTNNENANANANENANANANNNNVNNQNANANANNNNVNNQNANAPANNSNDKSTNSDKSGNVGPDKKGIFKFLCYSRKIFKD